MSSTEPSNRFPIREWIAITQRHLVLISLVVSITLLIACIFVMRMPNVYRAETRILVNPQRISDKYVSSAVSMDSTERLNTLSQQVMSSTRLESIINSLHLFPELRNRMGRDQLIELMRQHITIDLKQSSDGPSSFTLSYTGQDAKQVAAVTNQLAASFIDWNLRDRASEAEGTTSFLSQELTQSKQQLDTLEEQLRVYKTQHLGALPDQMEANLQTLSRLQVQLQANADAQSRLDRETILARSEPLLSGSSSSAQNMSPRQQLAQHDAQAHRELLELLSRYTVAYPEVIKKQAEVDAIDSQLVSSSTQTTPTSPPSTLEAAKTSDDPRLQLIDHDRKALTNERREIEAGINTYQARVDSAPIREQEMSQLLRDYDTAKEHYNSLLEKTYSAEMAAELEHQQEGGTFTMLDPAHVPDVPIGPNRAAMIGSFTVFAIALGICAAFLREITDNTVKCEGELLQLASQVPILGVTPTLLAPSKRLHGEQWVKESA